MNDTKITGYRVLTDEEIQLVNEIKRIGNEIGKLMGKLQSQPELDQRWVSIGKTHLQQGFMALTRSVAKPEGF